MAVRAVISDFGGVLTTPLRDSFAAFEQRTGVGAADFARALASLGAARGENPLFALETGRLAEPDFLALLGAELGGALGEPGALDAFGEAFFAGLAPNRPFLDYLDGLYRDGVRLAICTNNVREWSSRWRAMVPDPERFEVVVDSSQIGARKPDPRIYEVVLSQLGLSAGEAVFVDDLEVNCTAAAALGLHAVWFRDTEQAIADTQAALGRE